MIRFEAGQEEIAALLTFLRRRAPQGGLLLVFLPRPGKAIVRRRPLKTPRPLLDALEADWEAHLIGVAFVSESPSTSLTASDCLMQLFLSAATHARRQVLLEVRDALAGDPPTLTPEACLARELGERMARRLRRRGTREGNFWRLPD